MKFYFIDAMIITWREPSGKYPRQGAKRPGDACLAPTGAKRRGSLPIFPLVCQEYIGGEVRDMTAADIILIFIGIIGLLISFGSLIVAFLTFLDKRNSKKG